MFFFSPGFCTWHGIRNFHNSVMCVVSISPSAHGWCRPGLKLNIFFDIVTKSTGIKQWAEWYSIYHHYWFCAEFKIKSQNNTEHQLTLCHVTCGSQQDFLYLALLYNVWPDYYEVRPKKIFLVYGPIFVKFVTYT